MNPLGEKRINNVFKQALKEERRGRVIQMEGVQAVCQGCPVPLRRLK